ncbi:MAG: hypothetical protein ACAF42_09430 [Limnothrix sp. BL-A-16]|jgi:zinc transporter ZupT
MESGMNLDWLLGALAGGIVLGGLWMLASGMKAMNDEQNKKPK